MSTSKENKITSNYIFNLIFQILSTLVPLITTPYLSRILGAEGTGIYSYTFSITTYFLLFGMLGSSLYAQREIAYVQDNIKQRSKIFWEIIIIRIITLSISMLIFYLIYGMKGSYAIYYRIFLLEFIATMIDTGWFFQGIEEFKKIILRGTIIKLVTIILVFTIIKNPDDLAKYILIYVISTMLGVLALLPYLKKYVIKIQFKELNIKKHIKPILILLIPQIASQIYTLIDRVMIGNILNDMAEVGYYEQTQKIIRLLIMVITSLGTIMLPRIANDFAKGNEDKIKKYIQKSFNFVFAVAIPMTIGIILVSNEFVPIFYGKGYDKVVILLKLLSPLIILIGLTNVLGIQYLLPTKKQKEYNIAIIAGAIINIFANLICIHYFNSIGACIATLIAELSIFMIELYYVRKKLNFKEYIKISKNYLISCIFMILICSLLTNINISNILKLILKPICGGIIYLITLFILKDEFLMNFMNKFIKKLKKGHQ